MLSTITQSKAYSLIGVDMGSYSLRAAQIRKSPSSNLVSTVSQLRRRAPAGFEDSALAGQVLMCMEQAEFRGRSAVMALNMPEVECFMLELPKVGSGERKEMVRWEVERLSTQGDEGVETDYWSLPNTDVTAPNVIGVASPRATIDRVLAVCQDGGKRCVRIDAAACALSRFGSQLNDWGHHDLWGILDIGFSQSRLILCLEETPILVRNVGAGGGKWTTLIADSLTVSEKSAEVHKEESGIAAVLSAHSSLSNRPGRRELPSMLLGILRSTLNDLTTEIKRSYDYMLSCYPGRQAADLVLVGGGALLPNLPPFLSDALGINVRPASTYLSEKTCRLDFVSDKQDRLEAFAQAIGAALDA